MPTPCCYLQVSGSLLSLTAGPSGLTASPGSCSLLRTDLQPPPALQRVLTPLCYQAHQSILHFPLPWPARAFATGDSPLGPLPSMSPSSSTSFHSRLVCPLGLPGLNRLFSISPSSLVTYHSFNLGKLNQGLGIWNSENHWGCCFSPCKQLRGLVCFGETQPLTSRRVFSPGSQLLPLASRWLVWGRKWTHYPCSLMTCSGDWPALHEAPSPSASCCFPVGPGEGGRPSTIHHPDHVPPTPATLNGVGT